MKTENFQNFLAKTMITGVVISAIVMLIGIIVYSFSHSHVVFHGHIFHGEPSYITSPLDILHFALKGNERSIIQIGILLLLINPFIRVFIIAIGFCLEKNKLYCFISLLVLAILIFSFFY